MKHVFAMLLAFLCFTMILVGNGCASEELKRPPAGDPEPAGSDLKGAFTDHASSAEAEDGADNSLQTVIIQEVADDSLEAEPVTLLNANLEEDLQTLEEMEIPPVEYQYGYYRKDSGELHTYDVDPDTSVTIYDVSQAYSQSEDRLHTFETYEDFVTAAQENEELLIPPYVLTLQNGHVVSIEEKFYN